MGDMFRQMAGTATGITLHFSEPPEVSEEPVLPKAGELFFAGGEATRKSDDGLIWKTVLRTGVWALTPGVDQMPIDKPLKVVRDNAGVGEIALSEILESFNDGAFEHVTVPLSHANRVDENTGFIKALRIVDEDGSSALQAGFEFTEPDVRDKVLNGSIANTSCGLVFDRRRPADGKTHKIALNHIALTNVPWISGMEPFGEALAASEDIASLHLEGQELPNPEAEVEETDDSELVELAPGEFRLNKNQIEKLKEELGEDTFSQLMGAAEELPEDTGDGEPEPETKAQVEVEPIMASELITLDELQLAQREREKRSETNNGSSEGGEDVSETGNEGRLQLSEDAQAEFDRLREQNETLLAETRQLRVDRRIEDLDKMGFSELGLTAFLKTARRLMLADDGGPALLLSEEAENGETKQIRLSSTDIVEQLVAALPTEDGKLKLSEQIHIDGNHGRPAADAEDERSQVDKSRAMAEWLGDEGALKTMKEGGE